MLTFDGPDETVLEEVLGESLIADSSPEKTSKRRFLIQEPPDDIIRWLGRRGRFTRLSLPIVFVNRVHTSKCTAGANGAARYLAVLSFVTVR
jgi:hypothetical protein